MLEDALRLWTTVEPYSGYRSATIAWRLLPAIDNGQIRLFYRSDECVGLVTWAFFTWEEFDTREYSGHEVFARRDGEVMVFLDMIALRGRTDVLWMCREIQDQFYVQYPHVKTAYAHRGERIGLYPSKGRCNETFAA